MSILTSNHRVRILVDKQLIYEFGFEEGAITQIPPIAYENIIKMEPSYSGMLMEIKMYPDVLSAKPHYPSHHARNAGADTAL